MKKIIQKANELDKIERYVIFLNVRSIKVQVTEHSFQTFSSVNDSYVAITTVKI